MKLKIYFLLNNFIVFIISSIVTVAVPTLPTTTPAAKFAISAASTSFHFAASAHVIVAITVSPAPVTS